MGPHLGGELLELDRVLIGGIEVQSLLSTPDCFVELAFLEMGLALIHKLFGQLDRSVLLNRCARLVSG